MKAKTEAQYWRVVAERIADKSAGSPYLCDIVSELFNWEWHDPMRQRMLDRIKGYLPDGWWTAYSPTSCDSDDLDPCNDIHNNPHREARMLAALWLAEAARTGEPT